MTRQQWIAESAERTRAQALGRPPRVCPNCGAHGAQHFQSERIVDDRLAPPVFTCAPRAPKAEAPTPTPAAARRPRLLDLFCCEGGASVGYDRAGFDVYGVDMDEQPLYPFAFYQGDAIDALRRLHAGEALAFMGIGATDLELLTIDDFDAIAASPPCQAHSTITPDKSKHIDLIPPTRELLLAIGKPFIMENVEGARRALLNPVKLCGSSFHLRVRRHRYFEANLWLTSIPCDHGAQGRPTGVYGDHPQDDSEYRRPDGTRRGAKATSLDEARTAMGMPWASWHGTTQAIPPAYTEFLGLQLIDHIREAA